MLRPRDLRRSSGTRTFLDAMHGGKVHLARFVLDALDRRIVNSPAGEQGRTPLMFAVCLREAELRGRFVRLLLEKGAEVNGQDESGRTALSLACELGHLDAVKLLVQHSADPELPDRAGNTPLIYSALCGRSAELRFLLRSYKRFGLRLDLTNRAGLSALEAARRSGHRDCERALSCPGRSPHRAEGEPATIRSPKPLSRQMLERFARPFSQQRREEEAGGDARMLLLPRGGGAAPLGRSVSSSPAQLPAGGGESQGSAMQRAHSWDGPGPRGAPVQCTSSRLLRRVTSPDFCQGLPGDLLRRERRDSNCSRSQLILPSNRQPLAL